MSCIKDKVALVIGGHRGLGFHCCVQLMKNGIKGLLITGRNEERGKKAVGELETYGNGDVHFKKCDVTVAHNFKCAFDAAVDRFRQLDLVINSMETVDECSWEHAIQLNLLSVCRGSLMAVKEYLPKYKSGPEGIVINVASVTGIQPLSSLPVYSSTKFGVVGLVRSLGNDYNYRKYHCRVMGLCPGLIEEIPVLASTDIKGVDLDLFDEETCHWPKQKSSDYAENLIKVLNEGKNGSVWITEGNHCFDWKFPNRNYFKV